MPSVSKSLSMLLKGSDVAKAGKTMVFGVISGVRDNTRGQVRGVNSPYIVDFDAELFPGFSSWGCNWTGARKLSSLIADETGNWVGWGVALEVVPATNPNTGEETKGLAVASVLKPSEVAKRRKLKPEAANGKKQNPEPVTSPVDWSKVPF
jgi:hypothetical protein